MSITWGLILAGGEGRRLRALTRLVAGDGRPKQFCSLLGRETLLEQTRRRAALLVSPARLPVVLTRAHERFFAPLVEGMPAHCAVVQPEDRGTAAAILYGLLRIERVTPLATVAILPSDHWVSDDAAFMRHVASAAAAVSLRPERVVLLGVSASHAETEYGWIEPGERIGQTSLFRVARFREKPDADAARELLARGCFWNSFVMVAALPALLALVRAAAPALWDAFAGLRPALGTRREARAARDVYRALAPVNFSDAVLASRQANLAVLPVTGVRWSDWGNPRRVISTLSQLGIRPEWTERAAGLA